MAINYDFGGWATRNDIKCSDGRTIRKNAFIDNDGATVPLVWNHDHNDATNVLGHALLKNCEDGVYAYCTCNDTPAGKTAKELVVHGDISSLSIYANKLKQDNNKNVMHGMIREVSLVLAGANPGAYIDSIMAHGEDSDEEAIIYTGELVELEHSEKEEEPQKEETKVAEETKKTEDEKTVADVIETMSEEQKQVLYALVGMAAEEGEDEDEGEDNKMKHNVFDQDEIMDDVLTHSDMQNIVALAKQNNIGSMQQAIKIYSEENDALSHGIDNIETLFPDYSDVKPGAPELITRDRNWVSEVMSSVHKSPISRIRTRQADARAEELNALGYTKGAKKKNGANIKLLKRTTDPQTVYRKDMLNRDDIVDITDFDVPAYQYQVMRGDLEEEIAKAILIGDGREEGDADKISEEHIRSIWNDDELYCIHVDVDYDAAKNELNGTGTGVSFGENYIKAEATVAAALYAREQYKGSGNLAYYCTPHSLNVMLLARDMNGRRIYNSKSDLAAALNVNAIHTVEQFEGKTREDAEHQKHKLVGLFVNLNDYQLGATKGGEITRFEQFDIDFNQMKYLIETRVSGALTKIYSAIALEEKTE